MVTTQLAFSPRLFFQYTTCPLWIWYDRYADQALRGELPQLNSTLLERGSVHKNDVISRLSYTEVKESGADGAARTKELMQAGVEWIYNGVLMGEWDGVQYSGRPDLLHRTAGNSKLGEYYYTPIDIRGSREMKRDHWFQLVLFAELLELQQGVFPQEVAIINASGDTLPLQIQVTHREKTTERIERILTIMRGTKPELRLSSKYRNSPWFDLCVQECEDQNDIALLYSLGVRTMDGLRSLGITTVTQMATIDISSIYQPLVDQMSPAKPTGLQRAQLQAKSLHQQEPIWITSPTIASAPLQIYFDIEGDSLRNTEYLFGFWVTGDSKLEHAHTGIVREYSEHDIPGYYIYFLAEHPNQQEQVWELLMQWLNSLPLEQTLFYHFAPYERTHMKQLAEYYDQQEELAPVLDRLVDLAPIIKRSVVLPLYFYSLKDIASNSLIGHRWRSRQANGAQSVFWYEEWLQHGNKTALTHSVDYNEDDVVAVAKVHNWLNTA